MDSIIFEKAIKLKEEIDNHPLILQLNKIEKTMEENKEVVALYFAKEKAISDYNFALSHFKEDSIEVKNAQKQLYEAKLKLDSHPLIQEYYSCYKKVKQLYNHINNILFKDFGYKNIIDN